MALKLVKISKEPERVKRQKSREEYLVACLSEESRDPKFTDWERQFIASMARQVGQGRRISQKQKEVIERLWDK